MERWNPSQIRSQRRPAIDAATLVRAAEIVEDVRVNGEKAVRAYAERFGDLESAQNPVYALPAELKKAYESLPREDQDLLQRTAQRIRAFAEGQRSCLQDFDTEVECGRAGHEAAPVETAGCYAPGGRYPLPSSVLMTVIPARVAGVRTVWVSSPKPAQITLAAAYVAEADGLLRAGGAQAIAALAYGCGPITPCDAVVGPGNRWVTAAKQLIAGQVAIDMLAGPSELAVLAAPDADPALIAADLLAQAEHDPDASAYLVTWSAELVEKVEAVLRTALPREGERGGGTAQLGRLIAIKTETEEEARKACDEIAPEHLQLAGTVTVRPTQYGALFVGDAAAEVFGDYGAGPNHTLPTGGTARSFGGLSVFTFLRIRTWMKGGALDPLLLEDTIRLARHEGLEYHARAADARSPVSPYRG